MYSTDIEVLAKQLLTPLQSLKVDAEYRENTFALSQTKLALDLVEATLLLQRFDAQQTQLELEPLHIGDIISKVMSSLRDYFHEQHLDYELDFTSSTPVINADRDIIEQAVKMLLYGTHMCNMNGSVVRLKVFRDTHGNVKLSLVAQGLDTDKIILRLNSSPQVLRTTPIDTSRSLFQLIGGNIHKTHTAKGRGFCVTLPSSKQLTLV